MNSAVLAGTLVAAALSFAAAAEAQGAKPAPAAPPAPRAAQAVPSAPQQTTASFADWTLRCNRLSPAMQSCEVVQTIGSQDRTVAQIALGRVAKGQPMRLTILVPPSVSFSTAPALLQTGQEPDSPVLELAWRRCLPTGCLADGALTDDMVRRFRGWSDTARITFPDAAGQTATLPFSPRGLTQALDALAKEDAG